MIKPVASVEYQVPSEERGTWYSALQAQHSVKGFTLIELIIVIIIIVVMAGLFLVRVPYYQEQAEKTAMEQVAGAVQSALVMRYGTLAARGAANEKELNALATDNPMTWLQQKPRNYMGEYFDPAPGAAAPGNWMFDLKSRNLIYVVDHGDYFTPGKDGRKWIRFHVRFQYDPRLGGGEGKELASTLFEPVEPYRWMN